MTNQQLLDLINQNIRQNGNEEITGNIMNSVLRALLDYINSKIIDNKFLIFQTEEEANNYLTEAITLEGVLSYTVEIDKFRYIYNGQWKDLTGNYLLNPENTGDTTQYPFVVGLNDNGETAKLPAGDLGKNFANTNLTVSENRIHNGNSSVEMQMPFIFSNPNIKLTGIQDKSSDATFVQTLVKDSNGNENYITNPYQLHKYQWNLLNEAQKRELITILSDNASDTSLMSVNTISPYVIQNRFDSVEYVIVRGSNLRMGEIGSIEIVDRDTNTVIVTIPRNKINSESSTELIFEYNFYNFPVGNYVLRIKRGVEEYLTSQEFRVLEQIENIDINAIQWEWVYANGVTPSVNDIAIGGDFTIETPLGSGAIPKVNLKSSELFAEGEDYSIEMQLNFSSKESDTDNNLSRIGLGYSNTNLSLNFGSLVYLGYVYVSGNRIATTLQPTSVSTPTSISLIITKTGNLFVTTVSGGSTQSATLSNNSGYSLFIQLLGRDVAFGSSRQIVQGKIIKAFKF